MKHTLRKMLCLLLALTITVGLLPVGMFAGAANVVVLGEGQILVDDDFKNAAAKEVVTTEIAGVTYEAVMGTNAFATIPEALSKSTSNGKVYVGPGRYEGNLSITTNIELYGAGMNINPNNADWSHNAQRADESRESVIIGQVTISTKALTNVVFNGFSMTGVCTFKEATSDSTLKGLDFCYNYMYPTGDVSAANGAMYFTGTTVRTGRLAYNRIESTGTAKPLTFRNPNNFVIEGNYIDVPGSSTGLWLAAEVADQSKVVGQLKQLIVRNNYIKTSSAAGSTPIWVNVAYADLVDVTIQNNELVGGVPISINAWEGATSAKQFNIEGNILNSIGADIQMAGVGSFDTSLFTVKNNVFGLGTVKCTWAPQGVLNLSYNYFKSGPTFDNSPAPITYPRYTDVDRTKLSGDMALDSVSLTGINVDGDRNAITGVTVDNVNNTVAVKETVSSTYSTIEVVANAKQSDSTIDIRYYSDAACTQELTGGNVVDYLKKGSNMVYIKLITSLDKYSYKVYTLTIPRESSHEALIGEIKGYSGTINGNNISITIPSNEGSPNMQFGVSAGATYQLYSDSALQNALGGTVISNLPAGSSTYYVKVTAEDGETTNKYTLTLTRAPYTAAEIVEVVSPEFVTYDDFEEAYLGVYTSKVETATVDIKVSDRATWKAYKDAACTQEADVTNVALTTGDTVFYIRVASESEAVVKVYKLILRKEAASASKQIFSVTSAAKSFEVTADTVTVKIATDITDYTPAFEYAGSYWKMYASYENGVLSDVVSANRLTNISGGKHTYYIEVTAADGSTKVYTFILERDPSKEAKLIAIGGGKEFYVDRFDFIATTVVQNDGAFYPTFEISAGATFAVKQGVNEISLPIDLRPGVSEYTIIVTAEDGVTATEYVWSITCIGDGTALLENGVVMNDAWADYEKGTPVYATIDGVAYKAYYGENAFSNFVAANAAANARGGIIYVMSGTAITTDINLSGIKLYGANFAVDANTANRYPESTIVSKVTIADSNTELKGFTFTETATIVNNAISGVEISNNIFADAAEREEAAISMELDGDVAYSNITVKGNRFDLNTEKAAIAISLVGSRFVVSNNAFANVGTGAMISVKVMAAGSTLEFANNTVTSNSAEAIWMGDAEARDGYLYIHDNNFASVRALTMDAAKAAETFAVNFNNNKVETAKIAVAIINAPASFATGLVANENTFATIDLSFSIDYATNVPAANLEAMDISRNYYSTATPGNDIFDTMYGYKPYYLNAAKTQLSNTINPVTITVGGQNIVDDGFSKYAVVSADNAVVVADFVKNANLANGTYGNVFVAETKGAYNSNSATVNVAPKATVYVTTFSHDASVSETQEILIYKQTANPVYNVYDVVNSSINGMKVNVVVEHNATTWTPNLAVINNLPITLYTNAACTKKAGATVKLSGDSTTVYGKVEGYETVEINIYKKLSSEKAILSIADAYTFEYTAAAALEITVDDRLSTADLSATVSEGATYTVYTDSALSNTIDETAVANTVTKLYYEVVAADDTIKVFEVTIAYVPVVDAVINSIEGATTLKLTDSYVNAKVKSYKASTGFTVKLNVPAGCTYALYTDAEHTMVVKNNTISFASNYVYVYATVTSPDGVVTNDYTIKLEKAASKVNFVDAIPSWAKKAVEFTKDLGIVNGEKVKGGYKLNASGTTTREMMACFIVRMMGVDVTQYSYVDLTATFADAEEVSDWAVPSMKAAVALGFFAGSKEGEDLVLNPKDNISREQFAIVFVRAIDAEDIDVKGYSLKYSDAAQISTWARTHVKIISKLGLMKGSAGKFNPKNPITRAEIIQTIYNYMK